jgi:hypothetical protein
MANKYTLKEITPESMRCVVWGCPAIYELVEITPKEMQCGLLGFCPSVYKSKKGEYFIIGEKVNPADAGLEKKVGANEALIKIPKALLSELSKKP